jgi:dihydroorotate dehydrogenase
MPARANLADAVSSREQTPRPVPLRTLPSPSSETLARWDSRLRPLLVRLPAPLAVRLYSQGRRHFLERLFAERPEPYEPPPELARTLWGLRFRTPLGNAAGMFKNAQGHELAWRQGAGYHLAGTTTSRPRPGNRAAGVAQPFAPYPRSGGASNWLGLPNDGDEAVAARVARLERRPGFPLGVSTAAAPGLPDDEALAGLVAGLDAFERAGADFLEVNESCPNTENGVPVGAEWRGLMRRLERIAEGFLARRRRPLPVILKFSVDTDPAEVPALVDALADLGFDGVDFGNTSTDYEVLRAAIEPPERRLYDHFRSCFGGGVSGRPLRERSLFLARAAAARLRERRPAHEMHVVRTGGVESGADLAASEAAGIALDGWFTGYFEAFARHGHGLYRAVYEELLAARDRAPARRAS